MKKMLGVLVAAGVLAGLSGARVFGAQDGSKEKKDQAVSQCAKGKIARRLGLTEDQAKKMKEFQKTKREAVAPLRKKLKEEMSSLRELVRDEAGDKEIQASLTRLAEARKALQAENEKFIKNLETVLTPSQRAKVLLAMGKLKNRFKGGAMGGRGRMR